MAKRMTDAQLSRSKRNQAYYSRTTSTLGLGALGLKAGASTIKLYPKASKLVAVKIPNLKIPVVEPAKIAEKSKKLSDAATTAAIGGAGVGGIGGYNFARYTREDSRRNAEKGVSKSMYYTSAFGVIHKAADTSGTSLIFGMQRRSKKEQNTQRVATSAAGGALGYGLVSLQTRGGKWAGRPAKMFRPTKAALIGAGIGGALGATSAVPKYKITEKHAKSMPRETRSALVAHRERLDAKEARAAKKASRVTTSVSKGYDPEESRHRRTGELIGLGAVGSGGLGYSAVRQGQKAKSSFAQYEGSNKRAMTAFGRKTVSEATRVKTAKKELESGNKALRATMTHGGKAAALGTGAALLGAGAVGVSRNAKKRGRTYEAWYTG